MIFAAKKELTDVRRAEVESDEREAAAAKHFPMTYGPIFDINDEQMKLNFPQVVRYLCRRESINLRGRKLWPTIKNKERLLSYIKCPPKIGVQLGSAIL